MKISGYGGKSGIGGAHPDTNVSGCADRQAAVLGEDTDIASLIKTLYFLFSFSNRKLISVQENN
jgi:hypothetical protein